MRSCSNTAVATTSVLCQSKVSEVYRSAVEQFLKHNIPDAEESARYLLCDVANIDYRLSSFQKSGGIVLSGEQLSRFSSHCQRRLDREPIQYIIRNWDFYGFRVKCSSPVLIPRPETEELVERILASGVLGAKSHSHAPHILDIGSGSGVIGIALLSEHPGATCVAIDIDSSAVALSRENVESVLCSQCDRQGQSSDANSKPTSRKCCRYEVKLSSVADLCADESNFGMFDLIVSNPPYIPSADMDGLQPEVRDHESRLALHGGATGLDLVQQIISSAGPLLSPSGSRELWMEVSHTHPAAIEAWMLRGSCSGTHAAAPRRDDRNRERDSSGLAPLSQFKFVEGMRDSFGQWRFVRLRLC
jgi:release factor glutamine methyltransferase